MKICTCGASPRRVERVCAGASGGLVEVRGGAGGGGASRCGFGCVRRSHDASHAGARRGAVVGEVRWFSAEAREVVKSVRCATCGKACIVRRTRSLISINSKVELPYINHNLKRKLFERPAVRPETGRARGPETREPSMEPSGVWRPRPQRVRNGDARARPKVRTQWGVPTGAERHTPSAIGIALGSCACNCKAVRSHL